MSTASLPWPPGHAALLSTRERHRIATLTVRENVIVIVLKGRKSLHAPSGSITVGARQAVAIPKLTQWDVVNDPAGQTRYEALALSFGDELLRAHDASFSSGDGRPPTVLKTARPFAPDEELQGAIDRAARTVLDPQASDALRRSRLVEVLILLAERGIRFTPAGDIGWTDRVRRLVAHRPHANWDVATVAAALQTSASTLRRRLSVDSQAAPGNAIVDARNVPNARGIAAIVREVRLETALSLLQATRLPVGEIAVRCGWRSHSRFTQAFQARWGFAPSLLRSAATREGETLAQTG